MGFCPPFMGIFATQAASAPVANALPDNCRIAELAGAQPQVLPSVPTKPNVTTLGTKGLHRKATEVTGSTPPAHSPQRRPQLTLACRNDFAAENATVASASLYTSGR